MVNSYFVVTFLVTGFHSYCRAVIEDDEASQDDYYSLQKTSVLQNGRGSQRRSPVNGVNLTSALSPYPKSEKAIDHIFAISETDIRVAGASSRRSVEELLCLDTLAGNLARKQPQIYRVSTQGLSPGNWEKDLLPGYNAHLLDMKTSLGIDVNTSFIYAPLKDIVANFKMAGYIRSGSQDASSDAAITLAAASENLLVAASDGVAKALESAGLSMVRDLRNKTVKDVLEESLPSLSKRVVCFQDRHMILYLADYAVFARAPWMEFGSDKASQDAILSRVETPGVAFGWHGELKFVDALTARGIYVNAADWSRNLAALSNVPLSNVSATELFASPKKVLCACSKPGHEQKNQYSCDDGTVGSCPAEAVCYAADKFEKGEWTDGCRGNSTGDAKHTVAFVMTDGDNIQWLFGNWSRETSMWAHPKRGTVPCGWTYSPSAKWLGPRVLQNVMSSLTKNDELIAGPAGVGYMFPENWPNETVDEFVGLTQEGMRAAGMTIINPIGHDDGIARVDVLEKWLTADSPGMIYWSWGGGYSQLQGEVWWSKGKPIISGRMSLWGNGTSGLMLGVDGLISLLKKLPKDSSVVDGYSVIPVHAWTHNYDDVLIVAKALEEAGGFDVVLPSELLKRLTAAHAAE